MTNGVSIKTIFFRPMKELPAFLNKRQGKDAGYDLYSKENTWFWPFQTKKVDTNSHIHIPNHHFGAVRCRSGRSENAWLVHDGTVDHGYTGNIGVTLTNLWLFPRRIKKGTRIAQLVAVPFTPLELEEVQSLKAYTETVMALSNSDRLDSGFGDSGLH